MNRRPWINHCRYHSVFNPLESDSFSDPNDEVNQDMVSLDSILPDDLLERILAYLPIASIFRAGCVCKRWHETVSSKRFLWNFSSHVLSQKPWYFMFTGTVDSYGYAYDPALRKWYSIDLPYFVTSNWSIASSFGLVCFMNNDSRSDLHVYNPITRCIKSLVEPPGIRFSDYTALAISTDRTSHSYKISIVKSKQVPDDVSQWDLSIHIYDSETMRWVTSLTEVLNRWRAGNESVICDGFLYFLLYSIGVSSSRALIKYNLSSRSSHGLLKRNFIPAPCSLTCGRLMNLKERLVMVGGIGKQDRCDIIKGIGIWVLNGTEWQEVAKMPHKYFQGFGEFDDVFASSGTDDVIYIQSYGAPALLSFDMQHKQWKWAQKGPVTKRLPLQLFTGFCFEPRLEISP
uniref:F-box domain-containing protein n=1 Tax=Opuntia streptacantha TaxID=393608 RepID=A0A7C8Z9I0_OPUST